MTEPADLFRGRRLILLDFDGPICAAFGPTGAARTAEALQAFAAARGLHLPNPTAATDPLAALRAIAHARPDLTRAADAQLRRLELLAIRDAAPTPGAAEFLHTATRAGKTVAIVSNNATEAIQHYLHAHRLDPLVTTIHGRPTDPTRMKPDPWTLHQALTTTGAHHADAVMIGDSPTDVQAAHALAIPCIGLANKPGKDQRLHNAGADALTTDMHLLNTHLGPS